jgi:hypothetical protein
MERHEQADVEARSVEAREVTGNPGMYTIHYEYDGSEHRLPMVFADKHSAMDSACVLLKAGYRVSRIEGPGFSIGARALHDYRRATSARFRDQALRDKRASAFAGHASEYRNGARNGWLDDEEETERAGVRRGTRRQ